MKKPILTRKQICDMFDYVDGALYWRNPPRNHMDKKGKIAGTKEPKGYVAISINGTKYRRGVLVYIMHYGHYPVVLDHINRVRDDDRIDNLRSITERGNRLNNGGKGVKRMGNKWQARIGQKSLGVFDTAELAREKYLKVKGELIDYEVNRCI